MVLVGHPFDTLKVRLQVDGASGAKKYKGPMDCLLKTVRNEGLLALYKGVRSPLSGTPFIYACSFGGWGLGEYLLKEYVPSTIEAKPNGAPGETQLTVPGLFYIGVFSGFVQSFVYVPTEMVKKRLMIQDNAKGVDPSKVRYKGMIDCARQVIKEGGIRKLYVGFPLVLAGYMPAVGLWYGSYGYFRRLLSKPGEEKNPPAHVSLIAGGLAGVVAYGTFFPLDLIGARLQTNQVYKPPAVVISEIWKAEGIAGFYRGYLPCLLRAFPADGALFLAYELTMKLLRYMNE